MESVSFHGEAFSEYYCTRLLWTDPQLSKEIDPKAADSLNGRVQACWINPANPAPPPAPATAAAPAANPPAKN